MDLLRMTPALTLNGEANFEWQPAAKATTQLITHVTSKSRQKKCWPAFAISARLPHIMAVFWDFLSKKVFETSEQPKPLFWFRSDTETLTVIGESNDPTYITCDI